MAWWIWLIIAVILLIVEIMTLDLVLLMLSGGAIAAAIAAGVGAESILTQVLVWAIVAVLLLIFVRKWALNKLRRNPEDAVTNTASYSGMPGVALSAVGVTGGRIKFNGEVWSARTENDQAIAEGSDIVVLHIDGATAVVAPHTPPHTQ